MEENNMNNLNNLNVNGNGNGNPMQFYDPAVYSGYMQQPRLYPN